MKRFFSQSIYNAKCVELRKGKENHHFLLHNSLQRKLHDDVIDVPCESFFFLTRISSRSLRKFTKFSSLTFLPSLAQINNNIFVGVPSLHVSCCVLPLFPSRFDMKIRRFFHTQGNNCVSLIKKMEFHSRRTGVVNSLLLQINCSNKDMHDYNSSSKQEAIRRL